MAATVATPSTSVPDSGVGRYWWIALAAGVLTVLVGLIALFFPEPTLLVVGVLFGAYLIFWGTMAIMRGVAGEHGSSTVWRVVLVMLGTFTALAGLVLLVRPGQSVLTAAWVLGFWWVLSGIMQLVAGFADAERRAWNIILGLLGIAAGTIILAQPGIGLITLVWIVSIGLIAQGAVEIALGLQIRKLHKEGLA